MDVDLVKLEKPLFFHRFMIVLSASLLISHTFSTIGFFTTGVTYALTGTFIFISLIGIIVGILAVFILPNVNSEKKGWFSFLVRGLVYFTLVSLAQVLGFYLAINKLIFPTVAIFSAGLLLLPIYSLITSAVSVIYLFELPNRSRFIRKLIPSLLFQRIFISVFAVWITYSTAIGILTPSGNFSPSLVNLLLPLLFVFGLETLREKLIFVLGNKTGGRCFSLLSIVYVASLGMIIILEMGVSNYDPVIHEQTIELNMILGPLDYISQMSTIWVFSLLTGLATVIGTIVPLYLNIMKNDVSWSKSINFLNRALTIAMLYLICSSFFVGLQISEESVNTTHAADGAPGYTNIAINLEFGSIMGEVLVCSEYDLQDMIYIVETRMGIEIPSDYDISFEHMQVTEIANSPIVLPIYEYCTNVILQNITYPEASDTSDTIELGISGFSKYDSLFVILHNDGEFVDIGSYTPPSEQELMISSIPVLGLVLGFPVIGFFNWRKYRKKHL